MGATGATGATGPQAYEIPIEDLMPSGGTSGNDQPPYVTSATTEDDADIGRMKYIQFLDGQTDAIYGQHFVPLGATALSLYLTHRPDAVAAASVAAQLGYSVAITDDYMVVGAPGDEDEGSNATGAAYVFERRGNAWTLVQKLFASDKQADDQFGFSVALYGDTCVVGARYEDTGGNDAGAAYVFTRSEGVWTEQQKLQASDKQTNDWFGYSVALYGDTCIVGARMEDTGGLEAGAAYVFTRSEGVWTEQQKLQASDKEAGDRFGHSVAIHGDTCVVGAIEEDTAGSNAGAVYVFARSGGTWSQTYKVTGEGADDYLGCSVAVYGTSFIAGAYGNNTGAGAAYVFLNSGGWGFQQKLQASDMQAYDWFGCAVAIYADTCIVGARLEDTGGNDAGAAYIFTRSGTTWTEQQKIQSTDIGAGDSFGFAVSLYAETCAVGACLEDAAGTDAGAAYIFDYYSSLGVGFQWRETAKVTPENTDVHVKLYLGTRALSIGVSLPYEDLGDDPAVVLRWTILEIDDLAIYSTSGWQRDALEYGASEPLALEDLGLFPGQHYQFVIARDGTADTLGDDWRLYGLVALYS